MRLDHLLSKQLDGNASSLSDKESTTWETGLRDCLSHCSAVKGYAPLTQDIFLSHGEVKLTLDATAGQINRPPHLNSRIRVTRYTYESKHNAREFR